MKFCLLRSGSSGNCTLIDHDGARVLLDAGGLSQTGFLQALCEVNTSLSAVDAAVISHLHSDHLNYSALALFCRFGIPLWIHRRNGPVLGALLEKYRCPQIAVRLFSEESFTIKDIEFTPFPVDHDAEGLTCGFRFGGLYGPARSVAYATDLGCFPDSLLPYFANSRAVVLEANHDAGLLWANPLRPLFHKKRVASDRGHLSNAQAAEALVKICRASRNAPEHVVLSHLSKDHNSSALAMEAVGAALQGCGFTGELLSAPRDGKTPFIELS